MYFFFFTETQALDVLALVAENRRLVDLNEQLRTENKCLQEECAKLVLTNEDLLRKLGEKKDENEQKDEEKLGIFNRTLLKDTDYQYYTGFSMERFTNIFSFLVPAGVNEPFTWTKTVTMAKKIELIDQLLLVMMKIRQNFDFVHLSLLFGLSSPDCSTLFFNWISYIFHRLGSLVIWPHRDEIIKNMPAKFRLDFPDTLAIIDGTEVKIQKPSGLNEQSQCYSDYKSCTTMKGLVGVDPRGSVIFASMLFSGSISDKELTQKSGFLKLLQDLRQQGKINEGDGIMADKGFPIEDEIRNIGLNLNIPPFATGEQMKAGDVSKTIKIAKHRVHVERAIARIKQFKILSGKIPLSLFGSVDQIWLVCCLLTNFMPFLIQD